ncbi:hypothetical protein ACU6U9_16190 [Pseudomonas sp. HK3]
MTSSVSYLVSDTKLSHDIKCKLPRYSDYQKNGGLKLFIVNNGAVTIAFAGTVSIAQDAFDQIKKESWDLQTTLKQLRISSLEDSNSTDFLLCDAMRLIKRYTKLLVELLRNLIIATLVTLMAINY